MSECWKLQICILCVWVMCSVLTVWASERPHGNSFREPLLSLQVTLRAINDRNVECSMPKKWGLYLRIVLLMFSVEYRSWKQCGRPAGLQGRAAVTVLLLAESKKLRNNVSGCEINIHITLIQGFAEWFSNSPVTFTFKHLVESWRLWFYPIRKPLDYTIVGWKTIRANLTSPSQGNDIITALIRIIWLWSVCTAGREFILSNVLDNIGCKHTESYLQTGEKTQKMTKQATKRYVYMNYLINHICVGFFCFYSWASALSELLSRLYHVCCSSVSVTHFTWPL